MKSFSTETLRKILSAVLVVAILLVILIQWIKTNFWYMFEDCSLLETIYVSDKWTISMTKEKLKEEESTEMFIHCDSLVGGEGTPYSYVGYDIEFARVDQGEEQPGYFTLRE